MRAEGRSRTTPVPGVRLDVSLHEPSAGPPSFSESGSGAARAPFDPRPTAVYLEPCALLQDAVALLLRRIGIRLVAATGSPDTALELLQLHHPELFLLELETPGRSLDGTECLRRACATDGRLTAIVLSMRDPATWAIEARRLGASAYLPKSAPAGVIEATVAAALEKSRCGEPLWSTLTPREQEIVELVSGGRTNAQVGRLLWLSPDTVKFHLANVYRKLDVTGRSEAARWTRLHAPALRGEPVRGRRAGPQRVYERQRVDSSGRHPTAA